jgi:hypothetical protein
VWFPAWHARPGGESSRAVRNWEPQAINLPILVVSTVTGHRRCETEMDFQYTAEQEAFRAQVREWLSQNLPPELCIDDPMDERIDPTSKCLKSGVHGRKNSQRLDGSASHG